jgi:hypothetical protein
LASRFAVFVVAFAFAMQSYIAQTHIHAEQQSVGGIAKIVSTELASHSKTPLNGNRVDCPLCQAVTHAGAFVSPTALILHLPFIWSEGIALVDAARAATDASAHDWQSRAPPRL